MLPRNHPERIHVAFDDHRLVANAGLILPATLALRLGLGELVARHVDLGDAPGRANTARGAAHFLRETLGRVRYAGAKGQLTVRADSGFYTRAIVAVCRKMKVRFSVTVRQHRSLRSLIEAIPEGTGSPSLTGWRASPTWPRLNTPPSRVSPTPLQYGSSSAG